MKKQLLIIALAFCSILTHGQLKIDNSGNVGIGTSTPSAKLNLIENGESTTQSTFTQGVGYAGFLLNTEYTANAFTPGLFWQTSNNYSTKPKGGIYLKETSTGSYMYLGTSNNYTTGITNDGLIITPSGTLQTVSGSASTPSFSFAGTTNTGIFSSGSGILNFSNAGSEKMRIESDGDVCIGTTSSSVKGRLYIVQDNSTDAACGLRVYKSSTGVGYGIISQVSDTSSKALVVQNSGDKFCVLGSGKTQIGGVYGYYPWMLTVWGTTYSYAGYYSSDVLFKQNITPVTTAIDKLNQINGVKYSYNNTAFPNRHFPNGYTYGVIAQEVQSVLPELVQADSAGYLAVNYDGLIPILIEAVKTQQKQIDDQQALISLQDEKINKLETEIVNCCNIKPSSTGKYINTNNGSTNENNSTEKFNGNLSPVLYQNIPNPFKDKTVIRYYLPNESSATSMIIFDMNGKLIKTYSINATGNGAIEINGGELQPGMYMYSLIANGKEIDTKKMILTE